MIIALQLMLACISVCVVVGIYKRQNVWALILLYWIILSTKNIIDLVATIT